MVANLAADAIPVFLAADAISLCKMSSWAWNDTDKVLKSWKGKTATNSISEYNLDCLSDPLY